MRNVRYSVFVFICLLHTGIAMASKNIPGDSLEIKLQGIVTNTLVTIPRSGRCPELRMTISTIIVAFSKKSEVERIIMSKSPGCLYSLHAPITESIRMQVKNLELDKRALKNKYIIFIRIPGFMDASLTDITQFPLNRDKAFDGLELESLRGKTLHSLIPIIIKYYPTVK